VTDGRVLRVPAEVLRQRSDSWFPFGGHLIEGLYRTARSIESAARQRNSLVTLGTLAAGLAHEINNPASAATRAVDALEARLRRCSRPSVGWPRTTSPPLSSPLWTLCVVSSSPSPRSLTRWSARIASRTSRPG